MLAEERPLQHSKSLKKMPHTKLKGCSQNVEFHKRTLHKHGATRWSNRNKFCKIPKEEKGE